MPEESGSDSFDAVIIGSGQAAKPLAVDLAEAGWRVAVVEREHVGGSCVNYGCTPTKTMVASARVAQLARRGPQYGVGTGEITVDQEAVRARKRRMVESFRGSVEKTLVETPGVELVRGHARFTGPQAVAVELTGGGARRLAAETIFINTGTRPATLPIPGLDTVPTLDNRTVMELGETPRRMAILGGGYIGVEIGQMFRRFGSEVVILQRGERLLGTEDDDVADGVREILELEGIEVRLGARTQRVTGSAGDLRLTVTVGGREEEIAASHLLVAAGRRPNADDLGLEAAGIERDERGYIPVNGTLATNVAGVYALGDVNGGPAFTHVAYDDYRIVRANLLDGASATTAGRLVPYTLFTDPQLGRVGLSERDAAAAGREVRVAKLPMTHVARAIETGETRGFMKALVDPETDRILGCAILGIEGGEVMAILQVAMMGDLPYTALRDGVFAHPTLAESLNNLFLALDSE